MQQNSNDAIRERWIIVAIWLLFAVLLAIVTSQHELFGDEVQPWLWVRYEHNLFAAMRYLRYEGHPALWTILLFALSRISANVLLLQLTNYLIAVGCAWLILSFRPLPLLLRVLVIFGGSYFFIAGVLARSYMLSGLLLVGAALVTLVQAADGFQPLEHSFDFFFLFGAQQRPVDGWRLALGSGLNGLARLSSLFQPGFLAQPEQRRPHARRRPRSSR